MPDLRHRLFQPEMMDDLSINDDRLTKSLDQLSLINRYLGGLSAISDILIPYFDRNQNRPIHILDIGTGIGDIPKHLLQDIGIRRSDLYITCVDINPATVAHAYQYLLDNLDQSVISQVRVTIADALNLPYDDNEFDIVMSSMFLHHFKAFDAVRILRNMNRVARDGVLINDLQRDQFAYEAITLLTQILPATEMVRNDAPISVARGFTRRELNLLALRAGLSNIRTTPHWAFRWVLRSGSL